LLILSAKRSDAGLFIPGFCCLLCDTLAALCLLVLRLDSLRVYASAQEPFASILDFVPTYRGVEAGRPRNKLRGAASKLLEGRVFGKVELLIKAGLLFGGRLMSGNRCEDRTFAAATGTAAATARAALPFINERRAIDSISSSPSFEARRVSDEDSC
jgi:hypothetical protein